MRGEEMRGECFKKNIFFGEKENLIIKNFLFIYVVLKFIFFKKSPTIEKKGIEYLLCSSTINHIFNRLATVFNHSNFWTNRYGQT